MGETLPTNPQNAQVTLFNLFYAAAFVNDIIVPKLDELTRHTNAYEEELRAKIVARNEFEAGLTNVIVANESEPSYSSVARQIVDSGIVTELLTRAQDTHVPDISNILRGWVVALREDRMAEFGYDAFIDWTNDKAEQLVVGKLVDISPINGVSPDEVFRPIDQSSAPEEPLPQTLRCSVISVNAPLAHLVVATGKDAHKDYNVYAFGQEIEGKDPEIKIGVNILEPDGTSETS